MRARAGAPTHRTSSLPSSSSIISEVANAISSVHGRRSHALCPRDTLQHRIATPQRRHRCHGGTLTSLRGARAAAVGGGGVGGWSQNKPQAASVGGHACCGWSVWRLRCLRTRRAAWAREISNLAIQEGWAPDWTQLPMYAGRCRQRSRQTWSRGPFCAGRFQRLTGRAVASATPHIAPVREAGDRQGAVGRRVHLTGLRSVVAKAA
jgi:hypothetical protein